MFAYSASQAVSPAINRTRTYLFRPFRFSTYLKLAVVATITEGFGGSSGFNASNHHGQSHAFAGAAPLTAGLFSWGSAAGVAAIAALVLAFIALAIYIFYLVTRLRFAFFHCLAHQTREILPGWRRYAVESMRMFKLYLAMGVIFMIALLALFGIAFATAWQVRSHMNGIGSVLRPPLSIAGILIFLLVFLLVALIVLAIEIVIHDFMLPHMALENATVAEAWWAARQRIAAEKGSFFLYGLLRVLLPVVACIAVFIAAIIPMILLAVAVVLLAHGFNAFFAGASGGLAALHFTLLIVFAVAGVAGFMIAYFCLVGPIATWSRNYALLFYGGRYQALGDLLFPPPPPMPIAESPQIA